MDRACAVDGNAGVSGLGNKKKARRASNHSCSAGGGVRVLEPLVPRIHRRLAERSARYDETSWSHVNSEWRMKTLTSRITLFGMHKLN